MSQILESSNSVTYKHISSWAARFIVGIVFIINVQCAFQFIFDPASFMGAYGLSGYAGQAALQGTGIAFLMWNVTYPAVIACPWHFRNLYIIVLIQQSVGLMGELYILQTLPADGFDTLISSLSRFVYFDAAGLILMMTAFIFLLWQNR